MWNTFHGPLKDEEILYLNIEYFKDTTQMYNFYNKYFSAHQDQKFFPQHLPLKNHFSIVEYFRGISLAETTPSLRLDK
jgi:hypothetical protein